MVEREEVTQGCCPSPCGDTLIARAPPGNSILSGFNFPSSQYFGSLGPLSVEIDSVMECPVMSVVKGVEWIVQLSHAYLLRITILKSVKHSRLTTAGH